MKIDDFLILATLATTVANIVNGAKTNGFWIWTWNCVGNKCVRSRYPTTDTSQNTEFKNLDICRLSCGKYGGLWPQPTGRVNISRDIVLLDPSKIHFDLERVAKGNDMLGGPAADFMRKVSQKFSHDVKILCTSQCVSLTSNTLNVRISTNNPELDLNWQTDESYVLHVRSQGISEFYNITATIEAETVFGARHGLQTLLQLMAKTATVKHYKANKYPFLVMAKEAFVKDKPVYPHRGLLVDTSRNFLSMQTLRRTVDAMAHSKLNVLHWHATDTHSFPLLLPSIPQLAKYGAYSSDEIYTMQDMKELLDYAKVRGVRVQMEIDSPAHAGNGFQWTEGAGLGSVALCVNQQPWRSFCVQPPCGQLNPANENTYKLLSLIYKDLVKIFPVGDVFHMGGDEVAFNCWNCTEEILDYLSSTGRGRQEEDFIDLWGEFHQRSLQVLDEITGDPDIPVILWSSHLTDPDVIKGQLSNRRFVVQTWVNSTNPVPTKLLLKGYKLIVTTKDAWYLDHGFWGRTNYYQWTVVYENRIPDPSKGVLGGETAMWGEYVDEGGLDERIWPRAAAAAERLWSNPATNSSEASPRFLHHRQRLLHFGIRAAAVLPEWCYQNEGNC